MSIVSRAILGSALGVGAACAALVIRVALSPGIVMEMDRDVPVIRGIYPVERAGDETFAWTGADAAFVLRGLDRRGPWTCTVRLRGGRSDVAMLPVATVAVDGAAVLAFQTTRDYRDVGVTLPPRPGIRGALVAVTSSNTMTPGPSDPRHLGVMIDRWTCQPAAHWLVLPTPSALLAAAGSGAALGCAIGLVTTGQLALFIAILCVAAAQCVPLASGVAMFTRYPDRAMRLAVWLAAILFVGVTTTEWMTRRRLEPEARFVAVFTAAALYLKLLVLLHPSKAPIDAVFHAHRLQAVLAGQYYFTQLMPSGVRFPYAIALYVFAAPWTRLTPDFVMLLRIVVSAAEATGGIFLYLLVSRLWYDRFAGAVAAALLPLVPRLFEIVGNANLTNAFGQAVALAVIAAAVLWRLDRTHPASVAALGALIAFAQLSHISTFTLLTVNLVVLAALYWWKGGRPLRSAAVALLVALCAAVTFSVAVYYGHFGEAYRSAVQVRASAAHQPVAVGRGAGVGTPVTLPRRATEAAALSVGTVGVGMFLLSMIGAAGRGRQGGSDSLTLAVAAWILTFVLMVASVVATPVEQPFQRYAAEFISRVSAATCPAIVVLAGAGAARWWRDRGLRRIAVAALLGLVLFRAQELWIGWLR